MNLGHAALAHRKVQPPDLESEGSCPGGEGHLQEGTRRSIHLCVMLFPIGFPTPQW